MLKKWWIEIEQTTGERPNEAEALTSEEAEIVIEDCGASAGECWICAMFVQKLRQDHKGYYLLREALEDDGLVEHLRQIIGRDVDEEPISPNWFIQLFRQMRKFFVRFIQNS
jgi:hypothetical protein